VKNIFRLITAPIVFIQNNFKSVVFISLVFFILFKSSDENAIKPANLYKIDLKGIILDNHKFLQEIDEASKENIKGVLIVVDSPGGLVPPSIENMLAIKELAKQKPVVVYASGMLTSGAYYSSIGADYIIANPGSIVGSIGVIFETMNTKKLLDKIGIKPQIVKSGKYKEVGAFYREWQDYEKDALKKLSNDIYHMFVEDVAKNRNLDISKSAKWANGRVFIAKEAKKLKLIDEVGNIKRAEEKLQKLSQVQDPIYNSKDPLQSFIEELKAQSKSFIIESTISKAYFF